MIDLSGYYPGATPTVTGLDTVEQALTALEAAVATRGGDYVYPLANGDCRYVDLEPRLEPSCLIGVVLHAAGVPLAWFTAPDSAGTSRNSEGIDALGEALGLGPQIGGLLYAAQGAQDTGSSWAAALEAARTAAVTNAVIADAAA